jgi:hypothetical protein
MFYALVSPPFSIRMIDPQHPVLREFATRFSDVAREELADHRQAVMALYAQFPSIVESAKIDGEKIAQDFADVLQDHSEHTPLIPSDLPTHNKSTAPTTPTARKTAPVEQRNPPSTLEHDASITSTERSSYRCAPMFSALVLFAVICFIMRIGLMSPHLHRINSCVLPPSPRCHSWTCVRACMYSCMHVYALMYVCLHVWMYVCMDARVTPSIVASQDSDGSAAVQYRR